MNLEIIILSEVSQTERQTYDITYNMILKKMIQMNLYTKLKDPQTQKTNSWLPQWGGVKGIN